MADMCVPILHILALGTMVLGTYLCPSVSLRIPALQRPKTLKVRRLHITFRQSLIPDHNYFNFKNFQMDKSS
ncbi:hypothetical protein F4774DRAFT_253233 [Daldinia eschscholtzii]|nr:hypothetical protein F4774DRAFT_253233 [Daldinia eschscholtzii]